jgi:serine/threonine-protein kinase
MGEVFLAEDTKLERSVALKVLPKDVAHDVSRRKRFLAEAKSASALNHANVCTIYEVGETAEGQPFIAMEYLEGHTLDALARSRRLKLPEIFSIGVQVANALEAARQSQVVHRDIKPGNIMVDTQGRVKVLDFGLAKRLDQAGKASVMTQEGAILGTPNYLSPELALGREVDSRSDIFSLGVVLYELAAGRNPFAGASFGDTVNNLLNCQPESLCGWNPTVTAEFERILFKCLEKEPGKRYATPRQLSDDLAKVATHLRTPRTRSSRARAVAVIVSAIGVTTLGLAWLMRSKPATPPAAPARTLTPVQQNSLAVLPFLNLSADQADEYLADGISVDLSTTLTQIGGLNMRSWLSCRAFKGKTDDIRKIGEQLSVAMVLAGSVTKAGDKLRVNAQLSDVVNGTQLWATTYDREMADILEIRSDIARQLANALKAQLRLEEAQHLVKTPTANVEAYRLYLQGRSLWKRRTGESLKQAVEQFQQATRKDPGFALAYAGLADCYVLLSEYVALPPRETFPQARATAQKALELDNTLPGPRVVLAIYLSHFEWKWEEAEAELRKVISSHPNYATARQRLAQLLEVRGKFSQALGEMRLAQEVDPVSPIILANVGLELFLAGQENQGVESLRRQLEVDSSFAPAHLHQGMIYLIQDRLDQAIEEFEKLPQLDPGGVWAHYLGVAYARAGRVGEARKVLAELEHLQGLGLDYRLGIALVQQALNDDAKAMDSLEKALEERATGLQWLYSDPLYKNLRAHPRAQAVLRKMDLVK